MNVPLRLGHQAQKSETLYVNSLDWPDNDIFRIRFSD